MSNNAQTCRRETVNATADTELWRHIVDHLFDFKKWKNEKRKQNKNRNEYTM